MSKNEVNSEAELQAKIAKLEKKNKELLETNKSQASRIKKLTEDFHAHYLVDNMIIHNKKVRFNWYHFCDELHRSMNKAIINMVTPLDAMQAFEPDDWARLAELEATMRQVLEKLALLKKSPVTQFVEGVIEE